MRTILQKRFSAAMLAACLSAGAVLPLVAHAQAATSGAQSAPSPAAANTPAQKSDPAAMRARMQQQMQEHMAKRETELRDKLKLSPTQEPAWLAYVERTRPVMPGERPARAELDKMTAPERMEWMLARMQEHEKQLQSRLEATRSFYAQLSPEQRKVFDTETARGWGRGGGMHRAGGHHGMQHGDHHARHHGEQMRGQMEDMCPMHKAMHERKQEGATQKPAAS